MAMTEWTDWRNHDGKGVPAELKVGMMFDSESISKQRGLRSYMDMYKGNAVFRNGGSWNWQNSITRNPITLRFNTKIIRYRIRKPRALQQLIEMVEALPVVKHLEKTI